MSKKERELRKSWEAAKKRMDAMSLGGKKLKAAKPAAPKSLVADLLKVLDLNADRLASRGIGLGFKG